MRDEFKTNYSSFILHPSVHGFRKPDVAGSQTSGCLLAETAALVSSFGKPSFSRINASLSASINSPLTTKVFSVRNSPFLSCEGTRKTLHGEPQFRVSPVVLRYS